MQPRAQEEIATSHCTTRMVKGSKLFLEEQFLTFLNPKMFFKEHFWGFRAPG